MGKLYWPAVIAAGVGVAAPCKHREVPALGSPGSMALMGQLP